MSSSNDTALNARWRRLAAGVEAARVAVTSDDPNQCPDAVATTLDALYALWELWTQRAGGISFAAENDRVRGDQDGELTAALVFARGVMSHQAVEFGDFTDTISEQWFDHWGCWRWQTYADPNQEKRYVERQQWYAAHVANHEVMTVLDTAAGWLHQQPEL